MGYEKVGKENIMKILVLSPKFRSPSILGILMSPKNCDTHYACGKAELHVAKYDSIF